MITREDAKFVADRLRYNGKKHDYGMASGAMIEAADVIDALLAERDAYRQVAIDLAQEEGASLVSATKAVEEFYQEILKQNT